MDDAQLVAQALAGDRNACAAIYDRYADRMHDFCASLLRNRADAGDALQETFLVAFESLDRLAQPARLGAWLYTIAHRSVLDRISDEATPLRDGRRCAGVRGRTTNACRGPNWPSSYGRPQRASPSPTGRCLTSTSGRASKATTWPAPAGVAASELGPRLERLESQVERSLGALLVARTSRRACPGVYGLLDGWDGRLTPEFRDRVTAHCDDCEVCNSRRRILLNPLVLLAGGADRPRARLSPVGGPGQGRARPPGAGGRQPAVAGGGQRRLDVRPPGIPRPQRGRGPASGENRRRSSPAPGRRRSSPFWAGAGRPQPAPGPRR